MSLDLFGARPKNDPKRISEIKAWVMEIFRLPADECVMVTELKCLEPDCPPLETVIAILHGPGQTRQFKIHKAIEDLTFADIGQAAGGKE